MGASRDCTCHRFLVN